MSASSRLIVHSEMMVNLGRLVSIERLRSSRMTGEPASRMLKPSRSKRSITDCTALTSSLFSASLSTTRRPAGAAAPVEAPSPGASSKPPMRVSVASSVVSPSRPASTSSTLNSTPSLEKALERITSAVVVASSDRIILR